MKRVFLSVINRYQIVPAMVSVSMHAALLWFLALCFSNIASRKSSKTSMAAVAYFKKSNANYSEAFKQTKHIPQPVLKKIPKVFKPAKVAQIANLGLQQEKVSGARIADEGVNHHQKEIAFGVEPLFRPYPQLVNGDEVRVPYPERARQLMIEGVVRMRLTISEAGRVINAEVLSGPAFGLRHAALLVARKLFFLPATDELGQAKTAHVEHDVVFRLNKRS
jgi:TonB family protein